jgi:hypothetical protein
MPLYQHLLKECGYLDSGASRHMTGTHEVFTSQSEMDSNLHLELGIHSKCGVE